MKLYVDCILKVGGMCWPVQPVMFIKMSVTIKSHVCIGVYFLKLKSIHCIKILIETFGSSETLYVMFFTCQLDLELTSY